MMSILSALRSRRGGRKAPRAKTAAFGRRDSTGLAMPPDGAQRADPDAAPASAIGRRLSRPAIPAILSALLLSACASSTPDRFYTLSGASAAGTAGNAAITGAGAGPGGTAGPGQAATATAAPYFIEVTAVTVPAQVSRNQLVVTKTDGSLDLLEQQRWAGPLASEIRQAISLDVSGELGAIDVARTPYPEKSTLYRISTTVQRFESAPDRYALIDAVWSVRLLGSNNVVTCRSVVNESVGPGYEALVAGHRRAVSRIGAAMSKTIRSLAAGQPAGC